MLSRRAPAVSVGLLVAAVVCLPARAWRARTLTAYQDVRLVETIEAEDLDIAGDAAVFKDPYASGGRTVRLEAGGAHVSFSRRLPEGVYAVWLYARVPGAGMDGPWPPVYVEMTARGPRGAVQSRQRIAYQPTYQVVTRLFFLADRRARYRLTLSVGARSRQPLLLDFVEVRDAFAPAFGGAPPLKREAVKKRRTLTDDATLARIRRAAPKAKISHVLPANADAERLAALLRAVRRSLPPMNALLGGCDRPATPPLKELEKKLSTGTFKPSGLYEPWALVNEKTGERYDAAAYEAGKAYTGGLPDDGGGFYVPAGRHGAAKRALTIAPLGAFFLGRIQALVREAEKRGLEYERYADPTSAREAALLLVALAERFPTFDLRVQSTANNFGFGNYERWSQSTGNPIPPVALARIYDRIFDAVKDDRILAAAVGRVLPYVKTPVDLRAFLDRNVLQYALLAHHRFTYRTMQMGWEGRMCELLLALGPWGVGQKWMDHFMRHCYADLTGDGGYADYVLNGFHRDGSNYNGGTLYTTGSGPRAVQNCILLERFVRLGGRVPRFAYDPKANPRLLEVGTYLLNWRAAGGFTSIFGDGGGAIDRRFYPAGWLRGGGPVYRWLFRHTNDPRYARLAKAYGRSPEVGDEEWEAIEKAAKDRRDPILHAGTVCMPGFGNTILELGADSDDLKQKGAASIRHGTGKGHQHGDLLDLTLYAYNRRIVSDGGRSGWPWMRFTCQHNTVEVDRHSFQSTNVNSGAYGYPLVLTAAPGVRFASAGGWSTVHPNLDDYRRDVAMVDLGVHDDGAGPLRHYYVFDCIRVGGGRVHTYSVHAMQSRQIRFNVEHKPTDQAPPSLAHGARDPFTGVASDPLVTTWSAGNRDGRKAPHGLRHHLFGWGGRRFYGAWGAHRNYNWDMPFVWIERVSDQPIRDTYASVYEPFYAEPNLSSVRALRVEGGATGSRAARAVRVVSRWGRTDLVLINEPGRPVKVMDPAAGAGAAPLLETDAHFALVSEDAAGLVQASMGGGTALVRKGLRLKAARGAYAGRITAMDFRTQTITTDPPLPAERVDGAFLALGRAPHRTAEYLRVEDGKVRLRRALAVFRSPIRAVDEKASAVVPEIALPCTVMDPNFYIGCTATNEQHDRFWRVERTEVTEMWMPLFTPVHEADITDADGDGRRTVRVTRFAPPERTRDPVILYYGPFTKPVRMKQYNRAPFEEPVVLEVTRVDEARRRIYFRPPEDYELVWNGWVYEGTQVANESDTRRWRGQFPGREFRIVLSGDRPPREADFTDTASPLGEPADGVRRILLYHAGPGDPYRLETFVSVRRVGPKEVKVQANVEHRVALPRGLERAKAGTGRARSGASKAR